MVIGKRGSDGQCGLRFGPPPSNVFFLTVYGSGSQHAGQPACAPQSVQEKRERGREKERWVERDMKGGKRFGREIQRGEVENVEREKGEKERNSLRTVERHYKADLNHNTIKRSERPTFIKREDEEMRVLAESWFDEVYSLVWQEYICGVLRYFFMPNTSIF